MNLFGRINLLGELAKLAKEVDVAEGAILGYWADKTEARVLGGQDRDDAEIDAYTETCRIYRRRHSYRSTR